MGERRRGGGRRGMVMEEGGSGRGPLIILLCLTFCGRAMAALPGLVRTWRDRQAFQEGRPSKRKQLPSEASPKLTHAHCGGNTEGDGRGRKKGTLGALPACLCTHLKSASSPSHLSISIFHLSIYLYLYLPSDRLGFSLPLPP